MRLTVADIVKETGFCAETIRKYADSGKIPYRRAESGWRIFNEESIEAARKLAGIQKQEPATGDTARVGKLNN